MPKLLCWNLSKLGTKSRSLTGPLPLMYVRDLLQMVQQLQGVYLCGIQIGDPRRFTIPNTAVPEFKDFPVIYNPEILDQYDPITTKEGCLSFPGLWISIPHYKFVKVRYRDGNWKEVTATFGDDDPATPAGILAQAVQHEILHMDGHVIHERMKNDKPRIRVLAEIMKQSIAQNRARGVPEIEEGPAELDPNNLPVQKEENAAPTEALPQMQTSDLAVASDIQESTVDTPQEL